MIKLEPVAQLGDREGPGQVTQQGRIQIGPDGKRFFLTTNFEPGVVRVFDRSGRFVESFGRVGRGPGEYLGPHFVSPQADTLKVFDFESLRLTTLTDKDKRVIRTAPLPLMAHQAVPIGQGSFVFAALSRDPDFIGLPLHLYDETRQAITRSFGARSERVQPGRYLEHVRVIAPGPAGTVWSSMVSAYSAERWDTLGQMQVRIDRSADWFQPYFKPPAIAREVRPPPQIIALREVNGRLIVLVRVADARWQPLPPARVVRGMTLTSSSQENRIYDVIIEVIDIARRRLLASHRVGQNLLGFLNDDLVYSYDEDAIGNPFYRIWRVQFTLPTS